jgi:hypothetical protein
MPLRAKVVVVAFCAEEGPEWARVTLFDVEASAFIGHWKITLPA